jgi:DNA-binding NarL/FixJ family response regulator/REP element-mobilizing transposase RayT
MAIRVLIINRQLAFAVSLKQALERTGAFDVHPFTTANAALEYLQNHPQDVALVDFTSIGTDGANVIESLRRLQPTIALVTSPEQSADIMRLLRLQESIDPPYSARDVIPLLNSAVAAMSPSGATRVFDEPSSNSAPTQENPTKASPADTSPARPRPLRPGEISPEELRPYMYSSDVFKKRTEGFASETSEDDLPPQPPTTGALHEPQVVPDARRPGEFMTDELAAPSTDVFHGDSPREEEEPPLERSNRRRGAYTTENLQPPTTDVFRDLTPPAPVEPLRPGEYSEQDLLNLALNRGIETDDAARPRPGEMLTGDLDQYRVSTDIFKEGDGGTSSITQEDAAAMWEQLTRDGQPTQTALESALQGMGAAFDFEDDAPPPTNTDNLIAQARDSYFELPPEVIPPIEPVSKTDVLLARAEEAEFTADEASDFGGAWDFPDAAEGAPSDKPDTETLKTSKKPTDPLPPGVMEQILSSDSLDEQYGIDALTRGEDWKDLVTGDLPPRLNNTEELLARYQMPFDEAQPAPTDDEGDFRFEGDADAFQPPISPEQLAANWGQTVNLEDEPAQTSGTVVLTEYGDDPDAGVRQLEAIADEIRRTRETKSLAPEPMMERADEVFKRLAAEEPPVPDALDEGGTVGDLYAGVNDASFKNVLQILRGEEIPADAQQSALPAPLDEQPIITQGEIEEIFSSFGRTERDMGDDGDGGISSAQVILETALDESTPMDAFSLPALIASIERQLAQHKPSIRALPSWRSGDEDAAVGQDVFMREPAFLDAVIEQVEAEALPTLDESSAIEYGDGTTYAGEAQVELEPQNMETEWLPAAEVRPAFSDDWSLEPPIREDDTHGFTKPLDEAFIGEELPRIENEEPEFSTEFERLASFNMPGTDVGEYTPQMGMPVIQDPYLAQIALSLTQVSLEEVAAAVLTREDEVIAFAGRMGRDDIDEIGNAIGGRWDNPSAQANMRFVTSHSSGRDYMVYSRQTVNDLTLTLVFPGATSLRDIRRQGKRLAEALMAVPEPQADPRDTQTENAIDLAASAESDVRTMYTYVWLLRDPNQRLSEIVSRAIEAGITVQLQERAWSVHHLSVRDEFVYLLAEVPGEAPPYEVVRDLKRRATEIARKQNPALGKGELWADSYLVVSPGRELVEDEIQQFIQFERMM